MAGARPMFVRKRRSPERALHMSVAGYLARAWPADLPFTHFPAGELRDKATAGKLKGMGLKPGWPDFIFVLPNAQLACIELKAPGGVSSQAQEDLEDAFRKLGVGYATCRTMEEVEAVLIRWLAAFNRTPAATLVRRA